MPLKNLSDAVPIDLITQHFPEVTKTITADNVTNFLVNEAEKLPSACLFIWDEMVHRGQTKEPFKIAPIINADYEGIYDFIGTELKQPPFQDAYSVEFYNEFSSDSFAKVSLIRCYPADIHICDVEFSDNRKPVKEPHRPYKSLHVFDTFLDRLKEISKHQGVERISLMVAFPPLHSVFERHGFQVGKSEMAQIAFKKVGTGHSMFLSV